MSIHFLQLLFQPSWLGLLGLIVVDLIFGDPRSIPHPVVIVGRQLRFMENSLFKLGFSGRGGGIFLCIWLLLLFNGLLAGLIFLLCLLSPNLAIVCITLLCGWLLAFRSLQEHGHHVRQALEQNDLQKARSATSYLVGRDTQVMDGPACGRATIESLSENLVDGILAPLFWYAIFGVVGMLSFKIISTMDSMVGYKNERYFYFGWAGARLDDVMNYLPARFGYLMIMAVAFCHPKFSGPKAFLVGLKQHALLPSPNSGWAEAATAGALQIKLVGPIYSQGKLTTTIWIGDPDDPEGGSVKDLKHAAELITACTALMLGGVGVWMIF